MAFVVREFPGRVFDTIPEYEEAVERSKKLEAQMVEEETPTQVVATVVPASKELLERKIVGLEGKIRDLEVLVSRLLANKRSLRETVFNRDQLKIGDTLQGESRGRKYTLEIIAEGYLCSNGTIYSSLSGAAEGVSGNRRSGWKFWRDIHGTPVGEVTGKFKRNEDSRWPPLASDDMP